MKTEKIYLNRDISALFLAYISLECAIDNIKVKDSQFNIKTISTSCYKFLDSLLLDYSGNPVYNYIKNNCGGNTDMYHDENTVSANKISEWFLDCRENPVYKYCRDRLDREYDDLKDDINNTILI